MEKSKKSKKKLIGIIAGCAMAFVLTVVVSVAVTLAYFGQTKNATDATITMGQALEFNGDITATVAGETTVTNALPGQPAAIKVSGTIKKSTTKAFLVTTLSISADKASDKLDVPAISDAAFTVGGVTKTAKTYTDSETNKTYLYVATSEGNNCEEITLDSDTTFVITISYKIPTDADNSAAEAKITVSASASIIQTKYLGTEGADSSAIADVVKVLPAAA